MRCRCRAGSALIPVAQSGVAGRGSKQCRRNRLYNNKRGRQTGKTSHRNPATSMDLALFTKVLVSRVEGAIVGRARNPNRRFLLSVLLAKSVRENMNIKRFVPVYFKPLIRKFYLAIAYARPNSIASHYCPVCARGLSHFREDTQWHDVSCVFCNSGARQRMVWEFFRRSTDLYDGLAQTNAARGARDSIRECIRESARRWVYYR